MRKILTIILLFAFSKAITAQQDPQYTQFMYNNTVINPAYAGNRGVMSIMGLHRSQWVGLDGAPTTSNLSLHTPIKNSRVGLGLNVLSDKIGPTNETYVAADFSYTIPLKNDARLSLGLKGGIHSLNVDFTKLDIFNSSEFVIQDNIENKLSPTLGLGLYYHTDRFYIGLSTPNTLRTEHFDDRNANSTTFIAREFIHYFATLGYVFDLNDHVKFKPATLVKMVKGSPLQVDVTANFLLNEKFTLGAAYRWSAAVSGLLGFQLNEQMMIGFAYDYDTNELVNATNNNGSYEIFLRFELFNSYKRILTPRFF